MYKDKNKPKEYSKKYYPLHKEWKTKYNKTRNAYYKLQVMTSYSKGTPHCECCQEKAMEFLSIDHIYGGGKEHRKMTGSGISFYRWLINNNFPKGFRVLCMNCNHSFGHFGYCPHKGGNNAI